MPVVVQILSAFKSDGTVAQSWHGKQALLEPFLTGKFQKYVFQSGGPKHEIPQAFSHHSYGESNANMVIWDLQGVVKEGHYHLTDPFFVTDEDISCAIPALTTPVQLKARQSIYGNQHVTLSRVHTCNGYCQERQRPSQQTLVPVPRNTEWTYTDVYDAHDDLDVDIPDFYDVVQDDGIDSPDFYDGIQDDGIENPEFYDDLQDDGIDIPDFYDGIQDDGIDIPDFYDDFQDDGGF